MQEGGTIPDLEVSAGGGVIMVVSDSESSSESASLRAVAGRSGGGRPE